MDIQIGAGVSTLVMVVLVGVDILTTHIILMVMDGGETLIILDILIGMDIITDTGTAIIMEIIIGMGQMAIIMEDALVAAAVTEVELLETNDLMLAQLPL